MRISTRLGGWLVLGLGLGSPHAARAEADIDWGVALYLAGDPDTGLERACVAALRDVDAGGAAGERVRIVALLDRAADPDPGASDDDRGGALPVYASLVIPPRPTPAPPFGAPERPVMGVCRPTVWVGARTLRWGSPLGLDGSRARCLVPEGPAVPPDEAGLASGNTLRSFLEGVATRHPARRQAVVLKGHGDAWRGLCDDQSVPGILPRSELATALRAFTAARSAPIDLLALDACSMGTLEVLRSVAPSASAIVVSQDILMARSFPYAALGRLVRDASQADGPTLARALVAAYEEVSGSGAGGCSRDRRCGIVAAFTADRASAVVEAFDTMAREATRYLDAGGPAGDAVARARRLWAARAAAMRFLDPEQLDAASVARELAAIDDIGLAWAARRAADVAARAPLCVSSASDLHTACGVSVTWPSVSDPGYVLSGETGDWGRFLQRIWEVHACRSGGGEDGPETEVAVGPDGFVATTKLPAEEQSIGHVQLVFAESADGPRMRLPMARPVPTDGHLRVSGQFERLAFDIVCEDSNGTPHALQRPCDLESLEPTGSAGSRFSHAGIGRAIDVTASPLSRAKFRLRLDERRIAVFQPWRPADRLDGPTLVGRPRPWTRREWSVDVRCSFEGLDGAEPGTLSTVRNSPNRIRGMAIGRGTPLSVSTPANAVNCVMTETPGIVVVRIPSGTKLEMWFEARSDRESDFRSRPAFVTVP